MGDTIPDILKIVEEDIREVIKEVRSLENESLLVVAILVAAFVFSYFVVKRKIRSVPPGPSSLTDGGYLPFMKKNMHLDLVELGMKYGDVFSMRLDSVLVVFLQSAKVVEEAFSKTQLSDHPPDDIVNYLQDKSKFFVRNIHQWQGQEEYVTRTIKEFDTKQVQINDVAKDEINIFLGVLTSHKGKPMYLEAPLLATVSKTISALITNRRKEITKPKNYLDSDDVNSLEVGYKESINGGGENPFRAGSEAVIASIMWSIYIIAAFPEVQEKVRKEILDVMGPDRQTDMESMTYTRAVLMEVQRWKTVVPINAMRYTSSDATVSGYHLPRGTVVISNIWNVHNDPKNWRDPDKFNPDRFLNEHDNSVEIPSSYMPFSFGKKILSW